MRSCLSYSTIFAVNAVSDAHNIADLEAAVSNSLGLQAHFSLCATAVCSPGGNLCLGVELSNDIFACSVAHSCFAAHEGQIQALPCLSVLVCLGHVGQLCTPLFAWSQAQCHCVGVQSQELISYQAKIWKTSSI